MNTLKELRMKSKDPMAIIFSEEIKYEAKKWVKKLEEDTEGALLKYHFKDINIEIPLKMQRNWQIEWIRNFFNLEEE